MKTGKATLGANDFSIPELPFDPLDPDGVVPGCGAAESIFNSALNLPLAPGGSTVTAAVTFTPVVTGTGDTTPVTQAELSTTVPPTTAAPASTVPATVAPAATDELPRTGSSTLPVVSLFQAF